MKQEFKMYLVSLGMTAPLLKRARQVYEFYAGTVTEEVEGLVVCDYVNEASERQYESLWFFAKNYAMEARNFITSDDFDFAPMARRITYIRIKREQYEPGSASQSSRLYVSFRFSDGLTGDMKASMGNCEQLWDVFKAFVLPHLQGPSNV